MKNSLLLFLLIASFSVQAQNKLLHRGSIQFERKMNMHAQIDEMSKKGNSSWLQKAKERMDKYKVDKFELDFNKEVAIYQPAKDGISELKSPWMTKPAERNIVYTDFEKQLYTAQKEIYDKKILIKDSAAKYTWKIKEEYRNIAGYNCRRAETIIMDSVWVIAFYTDDIIASGGPESFNGLPGMILGLVMPRLNVTYFATEVTPYTDARREIEPPTKGKEYSLREFQDYLKSNMKNWGDYLEGILWYSSI